MVEVSLISTTLVSLFIVEIEYYGFYKKSSLTVRIYLGLSIPSLFCGPGPSLIHVPLSELRPFPADLLNGSECVFGDILVGL